MLTNGEGTLTECQLKHQDLGKDRNRDAVDSYGGKIRIPRFPTGRGSECLHVNEHMTFVEGCVCCVRRPLVSVLPGEANSNGEAVA